MIRKAISPYAVLLLLAACQQKDPTAREIAALRAEVAQLREQVQRVEGSKNPPTPQAGAWQLVTGAHGELYLLNTRAGEVFERSISNHKSVWTALHENSETLTKLQAIEDLLTKGGSPAAVKTK